MSELIEWPVIDMDPATVAALRRRGGNLYVWIDQASLLRARARPSDEEITYDDTVVVHDCSIHIDSTIYPSLRRWGIKWRRLPWPHFSVVPLGVGADIFDVLIDGSARYPG